MTLVLGIDPGTATIGYSLVTELPNGDCEAIAFGTITTPKNTPPGDRLIVIYEGVRDIINQYHPDSAAVEKLFFASNVTTAISVGQARGVILLALAQSKLDIAEYSPNEVKLAVSGYGFADKRQMQEMVRILLRLDKIPKPDDAADALAIAITHLHTRRY